jgi:hypothetical protein
MVGVNSHRHTGKPSGRGSVNERPVVVGVHDVEAIGTKDFPQSEEQAGVEAQRQSQTQDSTTLSLDGVSQLSPTC